MSWKYLAAGLGAAALIIAAIVWWPTEPAAPVEEPPPPPDAPVAATPEPESPERAPLRPPAIDPSVVVQEPALTLEDSDAFLREQLASFDTPEAWLAQTDLIQLFVSVVEGARVGDYPRRYLEFLAPGGKPKVKKLGAGRFLLDPVSYRRYDSLVDGLEAVPPETFVQLFERLEPLINEAYLGLGEGSVDARARLLEAGRLVMQVPEPGDHVILVQPRVMFEYEDQQLEAQPPLVKQLMRMGPDNLRRVQAYARAVVDGLR